MDGPHEILRLVAKLNPRCNSFYSVYQFHPEVTDMDVAHALGKCKIPQAALVARAKWARQEELSEELVFNIHSKWFEENRHYQTSRVVIGLDMLRELATPAYTEFEGNWKCPVCWGRDAVKAGDLLIKCTACGSSGKRSPKDVRPSYGRPWDQIYKDYLGLLDRWESHLETIMKNNFPHIVAEIEENQAFFAKTMQKIA